MNEKKFKINNETGELEEIGNEYEIVIKETEQLINYEQLYDLMEQAKMIECKIEMLQANAKPIILKAMKEKGVSSFEYNGLKFQYRKGYMRENFDSKKLKEEMPEIFEKYSYLKGIDESLAISYKEAK